MIRTSPLLLVSAVCCVLVLPSTASGQSPDTAPAWKVGAMVVQYNSTKLDRPSPLTPPSPLSESLVFDPTDDILVTDPAGSRPRKVADGLAPALSQDGRYVAFCGLPGGGQQYTQIMVVNTDGTQRTQLTRIAGSPCAPAWSPDGLKIAFNAGTNKGPSLMVLDLVRSEIHFLALGSLPRWSPDGKKLVFLRPPEARNGPASIWIINSDGTGEKKIVDSRSLIPSASWGADGVSIIFTDDDHHRSAIFRVNLDGTNLAEIARDKNLEMYFPSISPDGKRLVVLEEEFGAHFLTLVDLATHKSHTLASGERGDLLWVDGR